MDKSDLKVGYLVKYRNGNLRMVMPNEGYYGLIFIGEDGSWMGVKDYDEQLICICDNDLDIIEVYGFSEYPSRALEQETDNRKLLWRREDKKEMTISEIEKELGYPIKIVKED